MNIPSLINNYNIYNSGNGGDVLVGVSGEVELPEFSSMTDTIEGTGMLGEIEDPATGQFESMTVKVPFSNIYGDNSIFSIAHQNDPVSLTLRASEQVLRGDNGVTEYKSARFVFRGRAKTVTPGSIKKGKKMEGSVEIELNYVKIEFDGVEQLELDKLNSVYKVQGVDQLATIRAQI